MQFYLTGMQLFIKYPPFTNQSQGEFFLNPAILINSERYLQLTTTGQTDSDRKLLDLPCTQSLTHYRSVRRQSRPVYTQGPINKSNNIQNYYPSPYDTFFRGDTLVFELNNVQQGVSSLVEKTILSA